MNVGDIVFVDSNVFVYAVSTDDALKNSRAREWLTALWSSGLGRLSWQVLIEFYANAVRKTETPKHEVRKYIEQLLAWNPVETNQALLQRAWYWTDKAHVSWWDALIVSAAEHGGCASLLSEDLQHGQRFDTVTVVNPFATSPDDLKLPPLDRARHRHTRAL